MIEILFLLSAGFLFYTYAGYPLLAAAWHRVSSKPVRRMYWEPRVSLIIVARNERAYIERKLRNCLAIDYPPNKLQIIVGLDNPTDGTDILVGNYEASGITIVQSSQHIGKASMLNRAVKRASGELIVFADARQELSARAVRELVSYFADPTVGAVSGELVLLDDSCKVACDGASVYWRYEKRIRSMESGIHSMVGASGALYAIRRGLFEPLPDDTVLDDVLIPMRIVMAGRRVVLAPEALAIEKVIDSPLLEFDRKVRTLFGNYQLLRRMPVLLMPYRNPVFIQFLSHKVSRLLAPYFLVLLFATNLVLLDGLYAITLFLQIAWYLMSIAGACIHLLPKREKNVHEVKEERAECA